MIKVEGKAGVYDHLEAGREARGRPREKAATPASGLVCWRRRHTTRHHTSRGVVTAVASSVETAAAPAQDERIEVVEYRRKEIHSVRPGRADVCSQGKGRERRVEEAA